ncbi:HAD family hydrolase [Thauera humireducens]|jgi:phosphoglycolate phosphatase-like HAD superfamily hydrolase|uniref:HAD family hydrolase n=1 Tax=Thauera humireducens TaxID=1134435 RepID=UPI0024A87FEC|nr:HAD family hydrolase [Thauera humireducens]
MKPIIALDADGVLLNYHEAYADAWARAFGARPALRDPVAYWPIDRWDVRRLHGDELAAFRDCFDAHFWSTIPAIPGAVDACHDLVEAGYDLVCVTAMERRFETARLLNLENLGFPISRVIATQSVQSDISPKAAALRELAPVAFVDDFLPYMRGISKNIHAALVLREPNGSPNEGSGLDHVDSQHADLADFARWWLNEK